MSQFPAEWEYNFNPNPATRTCDQCGQVHIADASHRKRVYVGAMEVEFYFCSAQCSYDFYLARLREGL